MQRDTVNTPKCWYMGTHDHKAVPIIHILTWTNNYGVVTTALSFPFVLIENPEPCNIYCVF